MTLTNSSPALPPDVARQLKIAAAALPPGAARYRTEASRTFLRLVREACAHYGVRQVATVLGVSGTTVASLRDRPAPQRVYAYPTPIQMRAVRAAWRDVQALRAQRHQLREVTVEWQRMRTALERLHQRIDTDNIMIGTALGVRPGTLDRFYQGLPKGRRTGTAG